MQDTLCSFYKLWITISLSESETVENLSAKKNQEKKLKEEKSETSFLDLLSYGKKILIFESYCEKLLFFEIS